jgi:two-component system chemotaxis sensor kinase CheA
VTGISDDAKALQAVFLEEASEILKEIERDLLDLETSPDNRTLVDGLFRHLHTLKGSAGVAGMDELAHYTHAVESMLDEVRNGRIAMSSVLASLLLEALDCLKGFITEASGEGPLDRHIVAESHRKILASMGKALAATSTRLSAMPAVDAPPNLAVPEPAVASEENPFIIQVLARPDFFPRPSELEAVSRSLEKLGKLITVSHEQSLPSDDRRQGDAFYLWRSFHLVTAADRAAIAAALADWSILHRVTIDQVNVPPESPADQARLDAAVDGVSQDVIGDRVAAQADGAELPPALPAEATPLHAAAVSNRPDGQAVQKLSSIRVDIGKLDKLVNLVGGLITVEARLESFEDTIETRDPELAEELLGILDDSSRILRELQDQAMNVRMVPIGGAFDSLHRMVRDYCRDTGKQARLLVTGQDTEVDKKVSEQISAPLKHIIRNALDHGIEAPAERIAQGKSAEGQVTLTAYHQYGLIVIQVQDDGKGIDVEAVTQSARCKGIIDGSRELSRREALELIFAPSVSTATVVTEVSGRGVGMDVVMRDIEALRGKVDVATEPRMGTTITLSIPQTLSIVECLVVSVGPNRYSIPLSSVEECVELAPQPAFANGSDVLDLRGDLVPFLRLRELFDIPGEPPPYEKIVIVSTGQRRAGLVVDSLLGNNQTVIKPMSPLHRDVRSFLGATILGDGEVVLVLDAIRLIDYGQSRQERLRAS